MGNEIASGLGATTTSTPDMTFIWDVIEQGASLLVQVHYGVGTGTGNTGTARIPLGSAAAVPVKPAPPQNITVAGSVAAAWGDNNQSYVVTFTGQMVCGGVNNIFSANNIPIIVYAYLN